MIHFEPVAMQCIDTEMIIVTMGQCTRDGDVELTPPCENADMFTIHRNPELCVPRWPSSRSEISRSNFCILYIGRGGQSLPPILTACDGDSGHISETKSVHTWLSRHGICNPEDFLRQIHTSEACATGDVLQSSSGECLDLDYAIHHPVDATSGDVFRFEIKQLQTSPAIHLMYMPYDKDPVYVGCIIWDPEIQTYELHQIDVQEET